MTNFLSVEAPAGRVYTLQPNNEGPFKTTVATASGGGATLTNLSSVLLVDPNTIVPLPSQVGNIEAPFATLVAAIAAAVSGDTILVCAPGFMAFDHIVVDKSLTIEGFGHDVSNFSDVPRYFKIPLPGLDVNIAGGGSLCLVGLDLQAIIEGTNTPQPVTCSTGTVVQIIDTMASSVVFTGDRGFVLMPDDTLDAWGAGGLSIVNGDLFTPSKRLVYPIADNTLIGTGLTTIALDFTPQGVYGNKWIIAGTLNAPTGSGLQNILWAATWDGGAGTLTLYNPGLAFNTVGASSFTFEARGYVVPV
jgi:hypothetical protein